MNEAKVGKQKNDEIGETGYKRSWKHASENVNLHRYIIARECTGKARYEES